MANDPGLDASVLCRVAVPGADRRFGRPRRRQPRGLSADSGPLPLASALIRDAFFASDLFDVGMLLERQGRGNPLQLWGQQVWDRSALTAHRLRESRDHARTEELMYSNSLVKVLPSTKMRVEAKAHTL